MAKEMFSNRIDSDLTNALKVEALAERRSVANMLEWILRERYSRADRLDLVDGAGRVVESVPASPVVPPVVHDVPVEAPRSWKSSAEMGSAARSLASRNGRCSADVARGTKCKLCGSVH